jgi:RNA polymerase sigma-70 factor, ECF subfamily
VSGVVQPSDAGQLLSDMRPPLTLTTSIRAARSAHPDLKVTEREFTDFLARRIDADELDEAAVARHAADLLLVCAMLRSETSAIAIFERSVIATLDKRVARIVGDAAVHEVQQRLREKLLVAKQGASAVIAQYAARGPLRAWVRVAAVRLALNLRGELNEIAEDDFDILGPDVDPVMQIVREKYAAEFHAAFERALRALEPSDRRLLRQQYVDGLGTEALSELYRIHRVTMFRRLVKIRNKLLATTRRELATRIKLQDTELDSVMRALKDRVDVTLERVLASRPAAGATRPRKTQRDR